MAEKRTDWHNQNGFTQEPDNKNGGGPYAPNASYMMPGPKGPYSEETDTYRTDSTGKVKDTIRFNRGKGKFDALQTGRR